MMSWLAKRFGYVKTPRQMDLAQAQRLLMRFDAASSTDQTRRHWARADGLAADAAADPMIRAILRNRGRYERFNNPYMTGQIRTLANDVIGTSPTLQLLTPNEGINDAIEDRWREWADAIQLSIKLGVMRECRVSDGEIFVRLVRNPGIRNPVKLDLMLIEAEQCTTPMSKIDHAGEIVDGIELDRYGNPAWYYFLKHHPGDTNATFRNAGDYVRIPAQDVIHYFRLERPGQHHGITEIVASLNLHAQRRGYRESVLTAARAAATLGAVILETEGTPDENAIPNPFESVELEHGMMTTAPYGMTARQMRPEQPSTGYRELNDQLVSEQARPLNMPFNVAAGDSSKYNYASGRLDHQTYDRSNSVDQRNLELIVLRPIVQAWAVEATGIRNYLPGRAGQVYLPTLRDPDWLVPCQWIWGERDHVDPVKESKAQSTRLENRTTTYATEYARQRKDWRRQVAQSGVELEALDDAGLLTVNPQIAPHVVTALKSVPELGEKSVVEMLTLFGISRGKAKRMVAAARGSVAEPSAPIDGSASIRRDNGQSTVSTGAIRR